MRPVQNSISSASVARRPAFSSTNATGTSSRRGTRSTPGLPSGRARIRVVVHQFFDRPLEEDVADDDLLQRQTEDAGRPLRRRAEPGGRVLGEPDDTPVVAEVVVAQLR